jgi:oligosaccharyl transferase (archaeosortase A-associated)
MSKRSAKKREKENKTEKTPPDDKAKATPEVKERPVPGAGSPKKDRSWPGNIFQTTDIYWYMGVLVAALFSFYLRAVLPWNRVFMGDTVMFSSETDAWYHMMLAKSTVINLQRLWFDPMTYFPHGTPIHFGPFNSWTICIFSYIFGLGHPSMHTVDVVGAFLPAVLGVLLVIPVYLIGKELGGRSCGLVSALVVAVLPGQLLSRTILAFTDHHAAEIFLSTLTMMFFLLAMRSGREMTFATLQKSWSSLKMPLLFSALAGISLGLYIDAWSSGFLFEGIIVVFIIIQSMVEHLKGRNVEYLGISGAITFFLAMLMVLPFVNPYFGFTSYLYSFFQPTILLLGIAGVLLISLFSRFLKEKGYSKVYFPVAAVGTVLLGTLIMSLALPQFAQTLFSGLSIFQPRAGGAATVGEVASLIYYQGEISLVNIQSNFPGMMAILSPFFLALIGLVLLLLRYIKAQRPGDLSVIVWSVVILLMALAQNRFTYYYGVNVALLSGFLAVWALRKAGISDLEGSLKDAKDTTRFLTSNIKVVVAALLIFMLLVYPSLSTSMVIARYVGGPDSDWLTSTQWLQNNTPSPGLELYKIYQYPKGGQYVYPDASYGIMSWWDYGHLIETVGHRMPNANPFQQGIGNATAGVPGSSPFFLAETEGQADKILGDLDKNRSTYMNTKYVMIDWDMATGKFYAMTAWSSIPITKYYGFFYQPQGDKLVPVRVYRSPFFKTMTARLFFFDGSEVPVTDAFAIAYQIVDQNGMQFPVIVESPKISKNYSELVQYVNESQGKGYQAEVVSKSEPQSLTPSVPLEALQHYRLVHESESAVTYDGQKFVKTFEHVPGAVIKGKASPGANVTIAVPVVTNRERVFIYRQSNLTDPQGEFTLVVPYSTQGPIEGGTNFDTMAVGPYQLSVEGMDHKVNVPEELVMSGGTIQV